MSADGWAALGFLTVLSALFALVCGVMALAGAL